MSPLELAQSLLESSSYSYASTQINLPLEMADFIIDWGQLNIPDDALFTDEDGSKGREREAHITVKYGLLSKELPDELREIAQATAPFPVVMGLVSLFTTNPEFDVVKLEVRSPELLRLNQLVSSAIASVDTHPRFNAHATLAYVHKGTCDQLEGMDVFADKEISREFVATGLVYSGPGADDDAERVKETLLFSRVAKPVTEAVLSPSAEDIKTIIHLIANCVKEANYSAAKFVPLANASLLDYGVSFANIPELVYAPACADENGLYLRVPSDYDLKDPKWPQSLYTVIHHEAVHMMQTDRSGNPEAMHASVNRYMQPSGSLDPDRYLQQKQEIMAHAATMVDGWRRQGLTSDEMLRKLRSGNWGFGQKYWMARKRYPQAFKLYTKYATEYIEQVHESAFEVNADPFSNCNFPADADRIRLFLQQRSRQPVAKLIL